MWWIRWEKETEDDKAMMKTMMMPVVVEGE